jgi:predicted nucleic-acid-binding Zn-ribbon protein
LEHQCPKCNIVMTRSRATSAVGKFSAIKEPIKYFTNKESSPLIPFVCSNCGLTEWYVEDPYKFK